MKGDEQSVHEREAALYQEQLEEYIRTSLSSGYTPTDILNHLRTQGYEEITVRAALQSINTKYYHNKLEIESNHSPILKIVVAGFLVVIICFLAFFYFLSPGSYEFFISLNDQVIAQGQPLEFLVSTTDEVELNIQVETAQGNFVLEKNILVESSQSLGVELPVDIPTGTYGVVVLEQRRGDVIEHNFGFIVGRGSTESTADIVQLTLALQEENSLLCEQINVISYKDQCYFSLAQAQQDENLCNFIITENEKDRCFLAQYVNGNPISCSLIQNVQIRDACESFS